MSAPPVSTAIAKAAPTSRDRPAKLGITSPHQSADSDSDAPPPHLESDTPEPAADAAEDPEADQEYAFALFANDKSDAAAAHTIILNNEDEDLGPGSILRPRALSYFFAEKAEGRRKEELKYAAVSGEEVLRRREQRAWGLEVGWRVQVVRASISRKAMSKKSSNITTGADADCKGAGDVVGRKKKPGKKHRILLRQERRKIQAAEEAKRKQMEIKGEAENEKRIRLNREKKLKRRAKEKAEKAKKAESQGGDGTTEAEKVGSVGMEG